MKKYILIIFLLLQLQATQINKISLSFLKNKIHLEKFKKKFNKDISIKTLRRIALHDMFFTAILQTNEPISERLEATAPGRMILYINLMALIYLCQDINTKKKLDIISNTNKIWQSLKKS